MFLKMFQGVSYCGTLLNTRVQYILSSSDYLVINNLRQDLGFRELT